VALLAAPARTTDFLEALDETGARPSPASRFRAVFGQRARQLLGGPAVTIRAEDGRLCLIAGLYVEGQTVAEAWFAPGEALKDRLLEAFVLARELLVEVCREASPVEVVAYASPISVAAPTLARWFGFTGPTPAQTPAGPFESWARRFR